MDLAELFRDHEQGLATRAQLRARGLPGTSLSAAVQDGRVHRVRRSVYAPSPLPPVPRHLVTAKGVSTAYVAHVRATLLSLGPSAAAMGRTAAALRGWGLLVEPARTVEVAVPHGRWRLPAGVRGQQRRQVRLASVEVAPGTTPLWLTADAQTATDCVRALPLLEAVVVCDSALRAGALSQDDLEREALIARGRDAARWTRVLQLVDGRAGSVLESVQRVRMLLEGLTGFSSQVVVRDRPELRVDFCFRQAGVVVEVDGARWHQDPVADRARDNVLACLGWRVLRYTWAEVVHDSARVVQEVRAAVEVGRPSVQVGAVVRAAAA